jgi:hypothetical protein
MRFEWLALLALKRLTLSGEQAWVNLAEIARLPSWRGKNKHSVTTNIGRYLQSLERTGLNLVSAEANWAGPYRLNVGALSIKFDIPLAEVMKRLRLGAVRPTLEREMLYRFAISYARSQWLVSQGKLVVNRKREHGENAYYRLMTLADDESLSPQLRLAARLAAVQVLFRLGRFGAARRTLLGDRALLRVVEDRALRAQYYLALAWSYQRGASGVASDRAVEAAISKATGYAEASGDRATLGLVARRIGGYLTKKGLHTEAVNQMLQALETSLITGNYEMVQASCGNIGSVIHRLGPDHYPEARRWLLLGIAIARWMRIGRDDAHGEMILGKILIEIGKPARAQWLLRRAERIAESSGNQVGIGDVKMVWAFWHRRFGTRADEKQALASAARLFRSLKNFDHKQKERYMRREFPETWPDALSTI